MALNLEAFSETFNNLLDQMPMTFIHDTISYIGTRTVLNEKIVYSEYGLSNGYKFSVIGNVADFEGVTAPVAGDLITVDGIEYRVINTEYDSFNVAIKIALGDKYI